MPPADSAAGLCTKAVWTRVRGVHRALPSGFAVLQQDLMLLALKQFLWDRLSFCFSYFGCFVFISLSYIYIYMYINGRFTGDLSALTGSVFKFCKAGCIFF